MGRVDDAGTTLCAVKTERHGRWVAVIAKWNKVPLSEPAFSRHRLEATVCCGALLRGHLVAFRDSDTTASLCCAYRSGV